MEFRSESHLTSSSEIGLVLGGGGAKGAYQIGCWKALREHGIEPKILAGTSIGALNATFIALEDLEGAERFWHGISWRMLIGAWWQQLLTPLILLGARFSWGKRNISHAWKIAHPMYLDNRVARIFSAFLQVVFAAMFLIGGPAIAYQAFSYFILGEMGLELLLLGLAIIAMSIVVCFIGLGFVGELLFEHYKLTLSDTSRLREHLFQCFKTHQDLSTTGKTLIFTVAKHIDIFDPDHPKFAEDIQGEFPTLYLLSPTPTFVPEYIDVSALERNLQFDVLGASMALGFGLVPTELIGGQEFFDGGYADNVPIFPALERGCKFIIVIHTNWKGKNIGHSSRGTSVLTIPSIRRQMIRIMRWKQLEKLPVNELMEWAHKKGVRVGRRGQPTLNAKERYLLDEPLNIQCDFLHLRPSKNLGGFWLGTLGFRQRTIHDLIQLGYNDCKSTLMQSRGEARSPAA
jgi:predicted acylesterase/phospholipase RssA